MAIAELMKMIKKIGLKKGDVLVEAECVEEYGEYQYPALMGYSAEELREVAKSMED